MCVCLCVLCECGSRRWARVPVRIHNVNCCAHGSLNAPILLLLLIRLIVLTADRNNHVRTLISSVVYWLRVYTSSLLATDNAPTKDKNEKKKSILTIWPLKKATKTNDRANNCHLRNAKTKRHRSDNYWKIRLIGNRNATWSLAKMTTTTFKNWKIENIFTETKIVIAAFVKADPSAQLCESKYLAPPFTLTEKISCVYCSSADCVSAHFVAQFRLRFLFSFEQFSFSFLFAPHTHTARPYTNTGRECMPCALCRHQKRKINMKSFLLFFFFVFSVWLIKIRTHTLTH